MCRRTEPPFRGPGEKPKFLRINQVYGWYSHGIGKLKCRKVSWYSSVLSDDLTDPRAFGWSKLNWLRSVVRRRICTDPPWFLDQCLYVWYVWNHLFNSSNWILFLVGYQKIVPSPAPGDVSSPTPTMLSLAQGVRFTWIGEEVSGWFY